MNLPKAVQAQLDQATSLQESINSTPEQRQGQAVEQTESTGQESEASKVFEGEQEQPTPNANDGGKDALYWQQRFNVIQGKYNAEVPALQQQVRQLQDQISQLNNQLANHSSQSDKAAEIADMLDDNLTEEELDLIGPELAGVIRKMVASSANNPELNELKTKVETFEREKQEHTEADFWANVNYHVPDWKDLQATREGQLYLTDIDPNTGRIRNDILQEAAKRFDSATVIQMFNELRSLTEGNRQIPESKQVPDTSRNQGNQYAKQAKVWSRQEINQFYTDKIKGVYTPEEADAIEADIFAAQNEGRIR